MNQYLGAVLSGAQSNILPPIPSRDEVCNLYTSFQGDTFYSSQYGSFPLQESTGLNDADIESMIQQTKSKGYTHFRITISWAYPTNPIGGCDLTQDLPELKRIMLKAIYARLYPILFLAMDGESVKDAQGNYVYNDPVGHTYGYDWGMENLERILGYLKQEIDITPYVLFCPGYDGVFYGWEPSNIKIPAFGALFRSILPNGYLAIEHNTGHIPLGNGQSDWDTNGLMKDYDVLMSEFNPWNLHEDSTWQVLGRCTRPYNRPPDQPIDDDPNPPFYLSQPTLRGKRHYIIFEVNTYTWSRGQISEDECKAELQYFRTMAPSATICSRLV